jgi:N-acyl-D-amino-acid deacylase
MARSPGIRSWHGVTTIVTGNCGVGFAPARPGEHSWLIELMEGVEDIPGSALHEGIEWGWESFPEYLDAVERMPRTLEVGTQIPHGALRVYVMGKRGADQEPATAADLEAMAKLVREGIRAGALAFSTNRLSSHTSIHGEPVPGTFAVREELQAMAQAVIDGGGALVQTVPAGSMGEDRDGPVRDVELYREISLATGAAFTFSTVQVHPNPGQWREMLARSAKANAAGARLVPQVLARPAGLLASFETFNPFANRPAYKEVEGLPIAERVARLREPERRARLLAEGKFDNAGMGIMRHSLRSAFAMDKGVVFEPDPSDSIAARAARLGVDPIEHLFDTLCDLALASVGGKTHAPRLLQRLRPRRSERHRRDADERSHGRGPRRRRCSLQHALRCGHADLHARPLGPRPDARAEAPARGGDPHVVEGAGGPLRPR